MWLVCTVIKRVTWLLIEHPCFYGYNAAFVTTIQGLVVIESEPQLAGAYIGWVNVMRHSVASRWVLHAMTFPPASPDRRCHRSKNKHFTALVWAFST